jgi:hypothetical protein
MSDDLQHDEASITRLLRRRFGEEGQTGSPAWAFIPQVRDAAGFQATRTLDAIACGLWPSRGLELQGFEIKCSRSDWLSELKNPAKAEAFIPYLDRFYIVVANANIVADGELPDGWGLLVAQKTRIVTRVQAQKQEALPIPRTMLAALLKGAGVVANLPPDEVAEAERQGYARGLSEGERASQRTRARLEERSKRLQGRIDDLARTAGADDQTLVAYLRGLGHQDIEKFGRAIRTVLDGERDVEHLRNRLKRLGQDGKVLGEQAERILANHGLLET